MDLYGFGLTYSAYRVVSAADTILNQGQQCGHGDFNRFGPMTVLPGGSTSGEYTVNYSYDLYGNRLSQSGDGSFPETATGHFSSRLPLPR